MPVNITIPTAVMITCDGDQFPVGIIIEAQNLSNQPGTRILKLAFCILTSTKYSQKKSQYGS